jgi:hypothetical protein
MPDPRNPSNKKPSEDDLERGGFNPRPGKTSQRKDQVGPMPTDAPGDAKTDDDKRRRDNGIRH